MSKMAKQNGIGALTNQFRPDSLRDFKSELSAFILNLLAIFEGDKAKEMGAQNQN